MKMTRLLSICITIVFCLQLCGCSLFTIDTDELLSPPELTGDLYPISEALKKSVNGEYTLKYPAAGNYRSAVILNDITGDGVFEAFAFYSMTDGETVTMYINAISYDGGQWTSVSQEKIVAGGIDRVDFCDLDGDGVEEILVGWQVYGTSEMQLAVYSFGNRSLSQRMLQRYTYFLCCDLNEDGSNDLFVMNFNTADAQRSANIYQLKNDGVTEIAGCAMDGSVKSVSEPVLSELSSGQPAVYIDAVKGAGAITEVLFVEKNELINRLYDPDTKQTTATLRSASMLCMDINNDGLLEIPVQLEIPTVSTGGTAEVFYLTRWCTYNGETLTTQLIAMMNYYDGYYIILPEKLINRMAVQRDTENRIRQIYAFSPEAGISHDAIVYIQAVPVGDWEAGKYSGLDLSELCRYEKTAVIGWVARDAQDAGLSLAILKENIHPIE